MWNLRSAGIFWLVVERHVGPPYALRPTRVEKLFDGGRERERQSQQFRDRHVALPALHLGHGDPTPRKHAERVYPAC
jgi:hypothetical protein